MLHNTIAMPGTQYNEGFKACKTPEVWTHQLRCTNPDLHAEQPMPTSQSKTNMHGRIRDKLQLGSNRWSHRSPSATTLAGPAMYCISRWNSASFSTQLCLVGVLTVAG